MSNLWQQFKLLLEYYFCSPDFPRVWCCSVAGGTSQGGYLLQVNVLLVSKEGQIGCVAGLYSIRRLAGCVKVFSFRVGSILHGTFAKS